MGRKKTFWLLGVAALSWGCGDIEMLDLAEADTQEQRPRVVRQKPAPSQQPVENPTARTDTQEADPTVQDSPGTTEPVEPSGVDVFPDVPPGPPVSTPEENPNQPEPPRDIETPPTAVTEPAVQPKTPDEQDPLARKLISDNPEDNLEVLNMALQRWIEKKGKLPERLEQLVMEEFLPMLPMEPVGKMFAIDRKAKLVVLVQQ
tara:strand:- start:24 stop:632 length:609 start_codon:yes stop_codon:yes gene_type:complete